MSTYNKEIDIILNYMCEMINVDYNTINIKEENWYQKHSWTIEQEKIFINWLTDYLHKNKKARLELYNTSRKFTKAKCEVSANWFTFNYGWELLDK